MNKYYYFSGSIFYALSQWMVLAIAARVISLEQVGSYVFYLAYVTPISIFFMFGFRGAISSDVSEEFFWSDYIKAQMMSACGYVMSISVLALIIKPNPVIFLAVSFLRFFEIFSDIRYGKWIRNGVSYRYGVSQFIRLVGFLFLCFGFYFFEPDAVYFVILYPLSVGMTFLFYDRKRGGGDVSSIGLSKSFLLLRKTFPLAVSTFLVALSFNIPRLVVEKTLGLEELALYAMLLYFISLASMPISSFSQLIVPVLARKKNSLDYVSIIKRMIFFAFLYGVFFIIGLMFFGNAILDLVYSIKSSFEYDVLLMLGASGLFVFLTISLKSILMASQSFVNVMVLAMILCVVSACMCFLFSKWFGFSGAILAYLISAFIGFLSTAWFSYKLKNIDCKEGL